MYEHLRGYCNAFLSVKPNLSNRPNNDEEDNGNDDDIHNNII